MADKFGSVDNTAYIFYVGSYEYNCIHYEYLRTICRLDHQLRDALHLDLYITNINIYYIVLVITSFIILKHVQLPQHFLLYSV